MIAAGMGLRGGSTAAATVACIPNSSSFAEVSSAVVCIQKSCLGSGVGVVGRNSSSRHIARVGFKDSRDRLLKPPHGERQESAAVAEDDDQTVEGSKMGDENLPSRRTALCSVLGALCLPHVQCDAASADFSPGFPGLKDWLRGQKQKTSGFLLAPINASRDRLSSALDLISADYISSSSYEETKSLINIAAQDCMPLEAGSLLDFQSRTGVQVCTFKLVLKNASSLLDKTDPTKLKAEELLDELIRSFVNLDEILASGATGGSPDRKNVTGALMETSVALDRFEGGVRACLGIA